MYKCTTPLILLLLSIVGAHCQTVVGIRGSEFTLNGQPTYTTSGGFPSADPSIQGTLLNVRAVQSVFDDAHYPVQGSREHSYQSSLARPVAFDYPDAPYNADRNLSEFLAALPTWRRAGLLAFTVNLQGGGPSDGNFGTHNQPHLNSGFDPHGNLKPAYAARLRQVIVRADQLGMTVIVGFFYQGSEHWVDMAPDDRYVKEAIRQASLFLKGLPNRNILIEIANEVAASIGYLHPVLQPDGILDAVLLAQKTVQHQIPVSFSMVGSIPLRGSREDSALHAVDYVMIHTNNKSAAGVHEYIRSTRAAAGRDRPVLINEDGISVFNLEAATEERVGWGYYDQGLNDYQDGFQSPPINWKINSLAKWVFFDQVARLSGSPAPPLVNGDTHTPGITMKGLAAGQTLTVPTAIEAVVAAIDPTWPIKRVEFFVDRRPYSYSLTGPYMLGNRPLWDIKGVSAGNHALRVVVYYRRGPAFTETCSMLEIPFVVGK